MMDTPKPGQRWVSRDPRDKGRMVEVLAVDQHFVRVCNWITKRPSEIRAGQFPRYYRLAEGADD
jgi:hypothetical protein